MCNLLLFVEFEYENDLMGHVLQFSWSQGLVMIKDTYEAIIIKSLAG